MYYYSLIFGILVGVFLVSSLAGNDLTIWALSDQEAPSQEPVQISNQITQAREDIENEVKKQGDIIGNQIREQFGFEDVQSNLTQAYQDSFSGDLNSTRVTLQATKSALEDSIISLLRSGQQLISVSQNQSLILENNTRDVLNTFGESLSNLSVSTNQIQSQMSWPQNQ
jgi:hypothetical protein